MGVPPCGFRLRVRNGLLNRRWILDKMLEMGKQISSVDLPDYAAGLSNAAAVSAVSGRIGPREARRWR